MKHRILTYLLAVAVMIVAAPAWGESYLVRTRGAANAEKLIADLESLGAQGVRWLPQISTVLVRNAPPGFESAAAGVNLVAAVGIDRDIRPALAVESGVGQVEGILPPVSGDSDPLFDLQWGHVAVSAPQAWAIGARGQGVRVAVLDTGIDADHPDLAPNLNLSLSRSFVPGEDFDVGPGNFWNHGTHMAGIIAAADNGEGIIGIAPEAELVAIKVLSQYDESGTWGQVVEGIVYAADIGAQVINISLTEPQGFPKNCRFDDVHYPAVNCIEIFNAVKSAVIYARRQGALVVASAGNDFLDLDHTGSRIAFPAELPGVISVAATAPFGWIQNPGGSLDHVASYSSHGRSGIDFSAPGGDFLWYFEDSSSTCTVGTETWSCWLFDLVYSTMPDGWTWATGTSPAAAHVSGVAALILSASDQPMSVSKLTTALKRGADQPSSPGRDVIHGFGRVNALQSIQH